MAVERNLQPARGVAIAADESESRLYRRVILRLIPFIFVCYVLNYIDRVNVSFAKLQFQGDLGLSDASYGLGVGLFYVGMAAAGLMRGRAIPLIGLLLTFVILRSIFLGTLENPEPRYTLECFPVVLVLGGVWLSGIRRRKALP